MKFEKIKKEIDEVEVPREAVLQAIERGIQQNQSINVKHFRRKRKWLMSSFAAASIFGITLAAGFINPTMNQVLAEAPIIGGIYEVFADKMGMNLAKQNQITELNQTLTKNGVTVQLTNAYFDGTTVSIIGHVSGNLDKGRNEQGEVSFDVNFDNNTGDRDPWLSGQSTDIKKSVSGYDFQWKLSYPFTTMQHDFTLPITIHTINGIKGDWNFVVPITRQNNQRFAINHVESFSQEEIQIKIREIDVALASSTLVFETVSLYKNDWIDLDKAEDDKGNVLFDYANNTEIAQSLEKDQYHVTLRKTMEKLADEAQSITFYPSLNISEPTVQKLLDSPSFTLNSQRSELGIVVNSVKEQGNTVIIDYQFRGLPDELSEHQFETVVNNLSYGFILVDKKVVDEIDVENPVPPKNHSLSSNNVKVLDRQNYHFQAVFNLDEEETIENFILQDTVLQFDFSSFINKKELAPFTVELAK